MGWSAGMALASVLVAVPALPATPAAPNSDHAAVSLAGTAPTCGRRTTHADPSAALPWAQRRYPPDWLAPLATGAGVTVAVIDSGVDTRHPQLRRRVAPGADFLDPSGDGTVDCTAHGTAVASIIAAEARAGITFRGLAPRARILPVRVSEQQVIDGRKSGRTVTAVQFARAIRWAVDHGADVLNLSVVLYRDEPSVRAAIGYAVEQDAVVVAAVGNLHDSGDPTPYPAAYPGVLGVGAVGPDGTRLPFSQVGSYVDVLAPGADILAAVPGDGHRRQNGTSYATPFVSATAALVRDYRPELSAPEVVERIVATADLAPDGGRSGAYGGVVLNPYRAITETRAPDASPPAETLPAAQPDPALTAQRDRRAHARERSLWLAAWAGAGTGVALVVAIVLPRGSRRRWRPGGQAAGGGPGLKTTTNSPDTRAEAGAPTAPTGTGPRSSFPC